MAAILNNILGTITDDILKPFTATVAGWILNSGFWDDNAVWDDNEQWKDGP